MKTTSQRHRTTMKTRTKTMKNSTPSSHLGKCTTITTTIRTRTINWTRALVSRAVRISTAIACVNCVAPPIRPSPPLPNQSTKRKRSTARMRSSSGSDSTAHTDEFQRAENEHAHVEERQRARRPMNSPMMTSTTTSKRMKIVDGRAPLKRRACPNVDASSSNAC